jgi:hypothetical protein
MKCAMTKSKTLATSRLPVKNTLQNVMIIRHKAITVNFKDKTGRL